MDMYTNPTYYPLFPVFAFCSFFLVLIPLPWHLQAWNVGTCAYIVWASVACLLEFINSVVWRNNTLNLAPVWCDISSKIILGAGVGIPAAGLCISRRLYTISAIKSTTVTFQDKRRAVITDSCIAFGIPVIVMALHYVVQTNRFNILEDVGCYPAIFNTPLAYVLVSMWPALLGCVSFVFSALTLRAFYTRRSEFAQFLSTHTSFNTSRYIRLMLLAISEMLCTIPISVYSAYISSKDVPMQPWISWAGTHYDFSYVGQIPAVEWMGDPDFRISVQLTCWLFPASALLFFFLFGFGTEARKHYHAAFLRIARVFGYKPTSDIPVHAPKTWNLDLSKSISAGSLHIYAPSPPAHFKRAKSLISSRGKCSNIDVEKAVGYSLPLPDYAPHDQQPSPTATYTGSDNNESEDATTNATPMASRSTEPSTIPAYHLPFKPPTINPTSSRTVQASRSLSDIRISVHTLYSVSD